MSEYIKVPDRFVKFLRVIQKAEKHDNLEQAMESVFDQITEHNPYSEEMSQSSLEWSECTALDCLDDDTPGDITKIIQPGEHKCEDFDGPICEVCHNREKSEGEGREITRTEDILYHLLMTIGSSATEINLSRKLAEAGKKRYDKPDQERYRKFVDDLVDTFLKHYKI